VDDYALALVGFGIVFLDFDCSDSIPRLKNVRQETILFIELHNALRYIFHKIFF